jgi:hypothetical protein
MNKPEINENNLRFLQEKLLNEGVSGLKLWFDGQEKFIQDYMLDLINLYTIELQDIRQTLSGKVYLSKDMLDKIKHG